MAGQVNLGQGPCLIVAGGTVVNAWGSQEADVVIEDGRISALVRPGAARGDVTVDARGCLVIPGGVDPHVHFSSPTQQVAVADDFESGTIAAAHGGTTTVIDFAWQINDTTAVAAIDDAMARADNKAVIDYGFHLVLTKGPDDQSQDLDTVVERGVTSFKLYMAYPRRGLMVDDAVLFRMLEWSAAQGALTMVHAENGAVTDLLARRAIERGDTAPRWHARSRPDLTEVEAVYRATVLAEMAEAPVYFVHVSTAGAARHIGDARRRGRPVFAETCPHYLLLDESVYDAPGMEGAKWVLTPPIRKAENQEPLWNALAIGDLQTVATDHCPFCFVGGKDRGEGDFSKIPNGGPGIEHRLSLLFHNGVLGGRFPVERWVNMVATAPARTFGLFPQKGAIAVGCDADLVVFDPDAAAAITAKTSHSAVDYSMYEGRKVQGLARTVISRGEVIVDRGDLKAPPGRGRYVPRGQSGVSG
jgi:dihydropyrimidinase